MEDTLTVLGTLLFMFLVLAAAVEVMVDMVRGGLERVGIKVLVSRVPLEDALKLAEQLPGSDPKAIERVKALAIASQDIALKLQEDRERLARIKAHLKDLGADIAPISGELERILLPLRNALERDERLRVYLLRVISAMIGGALVFATDFYILHILADMPSTAPYLKQADWARSVPLNILVGALGAAAGSSYWHDQLDRIRTLKSAFAELGGISKRI